MRNRHTACSRPQRSHGLTAGQADTFRNSRCLDGKDNQVKGAPAPNTTTAFKRIDARTLETQGKVSGKPTVATRVVVSPDGKTIRPFDSRSGNLLASDVSRLTPGASMLATRQ